MTDHIHLIAALIALSGLLYKARELRRDPDNPALRTICLVLAGLGVGVLLGWEPVYVGFDRVVGEPNLAKLFEHAGALTAAAAVQVLFLHLNNPHNARLRAWRRWAVLLGVLVAMTPAFLLADLRQETPDNFADRYAADPYIAWYMLFYLSFLGWAMLDILRTSARYARHAPPLLRLGIRLLEIGSVIGLAYVIHKAAWIITRRLDIVLPWPESSVTRLLVASGILFVTAGLVAPSIGKAIVDATRWPRRNRLYQQLHPLWLAVTTAVPDIVLYQHPDKIVIRSMAHSLYRRVIEIHDGILRLYPYADPTDLDAVRAQMKATEAPAYEVAAAVEAAAIASGIRRKQAGLGPCGAVEFPRDDGEALASDPEVAAERLARIARAYVHFSAVATTNAVER